MPQFSHAYAVGRVSGMNKSLLGSTVVMRIAGASSVQEALKFLSDAGWGDAVSRQAAETQADRHVLNACALIHTITPEPMVTDCFLLKYDILNLKLLLKSKSLGMEGIALSHCGVTDPDIMRHAIYEDDLSLLPDFLREAVEKVLNEISGKFDPLTVEAVLDQEMYRIIFQWLRKARNRKVTEYFRDEADMVNIMIALRVNSMRRGARFAEKLFVTGGTLEIAELVKVVDDPALLIRLIAGRPYAQALMRPIDEYLKGQPLSSMEKQMDDFKVDMLKGHRFDIDNVLPLIGYLMACEREAAAVRMILAAKAQNLAQDRLMERLREMYA